MTDTEKITTKSGIELLKIESVLDDTAEVVIQTEESRDRLLHWGLRQRPYGSWRVPLHPVWPERSRAFDHSALQIPVIQEDGYSELVIKLGSSSGFRFIVLFFFSRKKANGAITMAKIARSKFHGTTGEWLPNLYPGQDLKTLPIRLWR